MSSSGNAHHWRPRDMRAGSIHLPTLKLEGGRPSPRLAARALWEERAPMKAVADSRPEGALSSRVESPVRTLGIQGLSRSPVSRTARGTCEMAEAFRSRPLDPGPYTYLRRDALT
ncbi:MAG: transposase [Actinomycetota bacterium]